MRVCLVSYEFPPMTGGEATYTRNLAYGLQNDGHQVTLLLPDHAGVGGPDGSNFRIVEVPTIRRPLLRVGTFLQRAVALLPELISRYQIDVVHITFDYPTWPVSLRKIPVPVVSTLHHLHLEEGVSAMRYGFRASALPSMARLLLLSRSENGILAQCDAVIAVSEFTRRSAIRYAKLPPLKVRVVYNSFDSSFLGETEMASPAGRKEGGLPNRTPLVLYVGRLERSKGLDFLLEAALVLRDSGVPASFTLVGDDSTSYAQGLKRRVVKDGIGHMVNFTGRVDERKLLELYADCDLFVLPSMMEGMGVVLLEAMAAGKPCVATEVGGIPEVVIQGETGLLVRPGDAGGLAAAIVRLLEDQVSAAEMGIRGRERVRSRFSIEAMCRDTESVYAELKSGRASHRD